MSLYTAMEQELQKFGGVLRCTTCGREEPVVGIAEFLQTGWPKCHGYTMTWMTQRLLDEEAQGVR